jgi:SAM-dependent methyltransferase
MRKIFFNDHFVRLVKSKRGKALDLACGNGNFSMFLIKNHWKVDSVDWQNKNKLIPFKYCSYKKINLEKITSSQFQYILGFKKYDLILLLRFLHRPLFKFIPDSMKKGGLLFCETFMIENGVGKLNTKKYMLRKNELLNFKDRKLNLIHFYQGKDNQRDNLIQSAVFKKL